MRRCAAPFLHAPLGEMFVAKRGRVGPYRCPSRPRVEAMTVVVRQRGAFRRGSPGPEPVVSTPSERWRSTETGCRRQRTMTTARLPALNCPQSARKSGGTGSRDTRRQTPENDESAGQKPDDHDCTTTFTAAESSQRVRGPPPAVAGRPYTHEEPVRPDRLLDGMLPQGAAYVKRLTPPGPTSSPTMMSTMPQSI